MSLTDSRWAAVRRHEHQQVRDALLRPAPVHEWKCSITRADVRTGREYERAAIAAAEREAARGRG